MLVLSRRVGEKILIATDKGDVWVTLVEIRGQRIRLGVDAPIEIRISRSEARATRCTVVATDR